MDQPAFVEFRLADGSAAGGLRTMAGGPGPSVVFDKLHNIFWWNNQHMATGFGLWGRELAGTLGAVLSRNAELTLNMTLSAPLSTAGGSAGLWSSICTKRIMKISECPLTESKQLVPKLGPGLGIWARAWES